MKNIIKNIEKNNAKEYINFCQKETETELINFCKKYNIVVV
jgi:hypothetical protein